MNLSDSKKKLALAGVICGLVAACLAFLGNPANMAFCIACFIRDTAGALGMHQAEVVQYARPEIIGLVLGAFIISVGTKEYRSTGGYDYPYVCGRLECMGCFDRFYPWRGDRRICT